MENPREIPTGLAFFVDNTPYCLWDMPSEVRAKNERLILGFRPDFFSHQAALLAKGLDGSAQEASAAAMGLRIAYGHAAETFMALLFASIQAGNCIAAWLDLYTIRDIKALCKKVEQSQVFPTMLAKHPQNWAGFVAQIFRDAPEIIKSVDGSQAVGKAEVLSGVTKAISHLASDLCDDDSRGEYNSYKHGLRVVPVGISATIAPRDTAPIEVPGSQFGSLLLTTARVSKRDPINLVYQTRATNFDPQLILRRIFVAVACLECLHVFLVQEASMGTRRVPWRVFPSEAHYTAPWQGGPDLRSVKLPYLQIPEGAPLATADEVRQIYERIRSERTGAAALKP